MQSTEDESGERTYREQVIEHLQRQTQALEFMRGAALFFSALLVIGAIVWIATTLHGA
jgi:hypothetical protein